MTQFNLSGWALGHRSFIVYCMLALTVVGAISYYRLGRNEDPAFTFRTMVVQAAWPGATLQETIDQVTERIERTLKETPGLDFLRSYTSAGLATIFVTLKGSTPASEVPDIWYHVRKSVGDMRHTLPAGVVGPGFNDEFGDTFGIIYGFTADGFTHRELRDHVEDVRARLLRVPDVSKVEILGTQDETIIVEFSTEKMAGLGIDRGDVIAALRAQNAVNPAGTLQTGDERLALRVSGAFGSEQDILAINIASNGRLIRLSDIAEVRRGYVDPPQPMFRVNGKAAIGVAVAMRDGGDILTLGRNVQRTMDDITADLPVGIEPTLVADQSSVVRGAIGEFMTSLWQAIAIIMAVSVLSLGFRAGAIVALVDPADARDRVSGHAIRQHRSAAHFARRADHRADLAGRRRHEHDRCHDGAAGGRRSEGRGRHIRLQDAGVSHAHGIVRDHRRLRADRICGERRGRIHVLDLRGRQHRGLASWFVAVLFIPLLGVALLAPPKTAQRSAPGMAMRVFRRVLVAAMRMRWITILVDARLLCRCAPRLSPCAETVLPVVGPARSC